MHKKNNYERIKNIILDFSLKKQENINSLVELIRVLTKDEIIKLTTLIIPAECEKHGFVQGNYKLNKLL